MVKCQICNKEYSQISASHLRSHNTTMAQYKKRFPNAEVVGQEVRDKISKKNSGRVRTKSHKANLSASIQEGFAKGRIIHNKGLKGQWRTMPQKERKMRSKAAQNRPPVTEATRKKIGNAHCGKVRSKEEIDKWRVSYRKFLEKNGGSPQKGMKRSDKFKKNMSEIAKNRDSELVSKKVAQMNKARKGSKATPKQRETYSKARIKYMIENPDKLPKRMFNTIPEQEFEKVLEQRNIDYETQFHLPTVMALYDFFIGVNTIIEIDGPYHYNWKLHGNIGDNEETRKTLLQKQIERDKRKTRLAIENGFELYRIKVGQHLPDDWIQQLKDQEFDIEDWEER